MTTIKVSRDFSSTPGGRVRAMGPDSGEAFRDYLLKELRRKPTEIIEVILDGAEGYGSSFLEEAFGGLIRNRLISPQEALSRLKIVGVSPKYASYALEANGYMRDAAAKLNG